MRGNLSPPEAASFVVVEAMIGVFYVVLTFLDLAAGVLSPCVRAGTVLRGMLKNGLSEASKKRVVIVGGSSGGLTALDELRGDSSLDITLISDRGYWEFTPGILRCYVRPSHLRAITCPLGAPGARLIVGRVIAIDGGEGADASAGCRESPGSITVDMGVEGTHRVEFDACIMATGSSYAGAVKPNHERTVDERLATMVREHARLNAAQSVIVVGAGLVGVELAAEIAAEYRGAKSVRLVDANAEMLRGAPERAQRLVARWLSAHGVEALLGRRVSKIGETEVQLEGGATLTADVVYKCLGSPPNCAPLAPSSPLSLDARGAALVDETLRVRGWRNLFAVGDCMTMPSCPEPKSGWLAEQHAIVAAANVRALLRRRPLARYPDAVAGRGARSARPVCISLGPHHAVFALNWLVIGGPVGGELAAAAKWLIERTQLLRARGSAVGAAFYRLMEPSMRWASRVVVGGA